MIVEPGSDDRSVSYDVCIVGSGPAGLTVANELVRRPALGRICVLESGGRTTTPFADALRRVETSGIAIKEYSRERLLGGASSTWAGLSSLLDDIDFEQRPWVPGSGWPITRAALLPYHAQAAMRYGFPAPELFDDARWAKVAGAGDFAPRFDQLCPKVFLAPAEPQRFGKELAHVFDSSRADLYLDATVVRFDGDTDSGRAREAIARHSGGGTLRVRATVFVLACGGIENPRLLLASRYACPQGLGNEHDQVGRYLMNHPKGDYGRIVLEPPLRELPAYFGFFYEGFAGFFGLRASDTKQRSGKVLNCYVRFRPMYDWSHCEGVEAALYYVKRWKPLVRGFRRSRTGEVVPLRDYAETGDESDLQNERKTRSDHFHLAALAWKDRANVLAYLRHRLSRRRVPLVRSIVVRNFMEMEPRAGNRVTLGDGVDAFGVPVPIVHHEPSERDRRSVRALHEVLRDELAAAGWGRMVLAIDENVDPWPVDFDASHHIGTTRMGSDPRTSVVDASCRVHSTPNVFLAGSSVFPTSGHANPTYTLVALAIRLAEHLATDRVTTRTASSRSEDSAGSAEHGGSSA
jgi:choline dehydrogenase-like flavoprotein